MFHKLLIANRGEIACRVIHTARRMGVATVAVYSDADAGALHVQEADAAVRIGPAPAKDSYLNIGAILGAARETHADSVHPGYGFLAENADFAEACAKAGLVFVGPSPDAMRAMGSKAAAKQLMEAAGVPIVPGYHGDDQNPETLAAAAKKIRYPVLIKAWAGGGGKGMRVVEKADDLAAALAGAKREALSAFGDDRVLIEKYLERPRHIEVQVFGDRSGNIVHLYERDCSVQRRHQKVIEEAPAPNLDPAMRQAMHEAATAAARAVHYVNAGTIEFIVAGGAFYFMEMNTRLQVEHPVTEMITGLDLVEWQLRMASGEALPLTQDQIAATGHAVEARLYAEDPERDFLPQTGTLVLLRAPPATPDLRIETGVREGDTVTPYYDPMIAKLVASGADRAAAIHRLGDALSAYRVAGVTTNRDFLLRLARLPDFARGAVDTGFIAHHREALAASPIPDAAIMAASRALNESEKPRPSADRYSPWLLRDGWRLDGAVPREIRWRVGDAERSVQWPGGPAFAETTDGFDVVRMGNRFTVIDDNGSWHVDLVDPLAEREDVAAAGGRLTAPMPGKIVQVLARAGDTVKRGQPILILEAMKMEHTIAAPADGTVDAVNYTAGDLVEEGVTLIAFTAAAK
ncbi:MAG TPA: acetyl/propionyl/methylcrotonyl-CoA carboxylase subunit alpha [Stellaceae bacterium]|nr:acetyl/propionyl/methylcrotonyl-CoA carboxylase subunit alpha [Stellaceae bacterium]